jgi:hypothetical protein
MLRAIHKTKTKIYHTIPYICIQEKIYNKIHFKIIAAHFLTRHWKLQHSLEEEKTDL